MSEKYAEYFIEHEHGFRWRFYSSDVGILTIDYQDWDEEKRSWETKSSFQGLWLDDAEAICNIIKALAHGDNP